MLVSKKWDDPSNFVQKKLRHGEYRPVHKQIERWRKKRKKLGALALSNEIKTPRKSDTRKNFFSFDDEEQD